MSASATTTRILFLVPPGPRDAVLPSVPEGWDPVFVYSTNELSDAVIDGAKALVYATHDPLDRALLTRMRGLRLIQRLGVGIDPVDLEAARELGIAVANVPAGNAVAVAEYVIMAMIYILRQMPEAIEEGLAGKNPYPGLFEKGCWEVQGKTLGILGYGDIGHAVATRAKALGMEIASASLRGSAPSREEEELGARRLSFPDLLRRVDVLSLHVPLTDETRNLITGRELASMKRGAFLVNTARGGIVDEADLAAALRSGQLGGAAVDVLAVEPMELDNPLIGAPNLLLTPHSAGNSNDAAIYTVQQSLQNVERVLRGEEPHNRIC